MCNLHMLISVSAHSLATVVVLRVCFAAVGPVASSSSSSVTNVGRRINAIVIIVIVVCARVTRMHVIQGTAVKGAVVSGMKCHLSDPGCYAQLLLLLLLLLPLFFSSGSFLVSLCGFRRSFVRGPCLSVWLCLVAFSSLSNFWW